MVWNYRVTNCDGKHNAENKVKTFKLPQNPEERKGWITIILRDNIPTLKTSLLLRDTDRKITLQLHIIESYVPVAHHQCLIALNQVYFPLLHLHQEKLLELMVKLEI